MSYHHKLKIFISGIVLLIVIQIINTGCSFLPKNKIISKDEGISKIYCVGPSAFETSTYINFKNSSISDGFLDSVSKNGYIGFNNNYCYLMTQDSLKNFTRFYRLNLYTFEKEALDPAIKNKKGYLTQVKDGYLFCLTETFSNITVYKLKDKNLEKILNYDPDGYIEKTDFVNNKYLIYLQKYTNEVFIYDTESKENKLVSESITDFYADNKLIYMYNNKKDAIELYDYSKMQKLEKTYSLKLKKRKYQNDRKSLIAIHGNRLYFITSHSRPIPFTGLAYTGIVIHYIDLESGKLKSIVSLRHHFRYFKII